MVASYLCADHVHTAPTPLCWCPTSRTRLAYNPNCERAGVSTFPFGSQCPWICCVETAKADKVKERRTKNSTWVVLDLPQMCRMKEDNPLYGHPEGSP